MQYFGVPTCPYCKKRVNLIRTWSLKRQGEYRCPRCGGISNIYLSPLVYVFALVAIFAGVAIYFFHKFILNDITLTTGVQVVIPFAVFFLLSLFMVYLAKPVIKKVPRAQVDRKKRNKGGNFEERRMPAAGQQGQTGRIFYDGGDYQPHTSYQTGPQPQERDDQDMKIVEPRESRPAYGEAPVQRTAVAAVPQEEAPRQQAAAPRTQAPVEAPQAPVAKAQDPAPQKQASSGAQPAQVKASAPVAPRQAVEAPAVSPAPQAAQPATPAVSRPVAPAPVVTHLEAPKPKDDFFAKYDDPEYISRRLEELKREREQKSGQ